VVAAGPTRKSHSPAAQVAPYYGVSIFNSTIGNSFFLKDEQDGEKIGSGILLRD